MSAVIGELDDSMLINHFQRKADIARTSGIGRF
jgi:hypothetical protein